MAPYFTILLLSGLPLLLFPGLDFASTGVDLPTYSRYECSLSPEYIPSVSHGEAFQGKCFTASIAVPTLAQTGLRTNYLVQVRLTFKSGGGVPARPFSGTEPLVYGYRCERLLFSRFPM